MDLWYSFSLCFSFLSFFLPDDEMIPPPVLPWWWCPEPPGVPPAPAAAAPPPEASAEASRSRKAFLSLSFLADPNMKALERFDLAGLLFLVRSQSRMEREKEKKTD